MSEKFQESILNFLSALRNEAYQSFMKDITCSKEYYCSEKEEVRYNNIIDSLPKEERSFIHNYTDREGLKYAVEAENAYVQG